MELAKEKKGQFFEMLILYEENVLAFLFYLNVECTEYTFRIYILLHIKKTLLHTLFLFVFKIVESFKKSSVYPKQRTFWSVIYKDLLFSKNK